MTLSLPEEVPGMNINLTIFQPTSGTGHSQVVRTPGLCVNIGHTDIEHSKTQVSIKNHIYHHDGIKCNVEKSRKYLESRSIHGSSYCTSFFYSYVIIEDYDR